MRIKSINKITNYNKQYVYDLKIKNNHNYFVGNAEINVHNSGKSTVASEVFNIPENLSFSPHGLKVFNSDKEFEHLLKKAGINADLRNLNNEEMWRIYANENPESIYTQAKIKAAKKYKNYLDNRMGMLIDITARNKQRVVNLKTELEEMGYDTYMVFVNTTLEEAIRRNEKRERKLKEKTIRDMWYEVQNNVDFFKNLFGNNLLIVNGNVPLTNGKLKLEPSVYKLANKWIKSKVDNHVAQEWIANAKKYRVHIGQ